jgi:glycosyltransferase involved in cell wall biosynthesis
MKVGFFSPLPPARTGVADYSAALLTELRKHGEIVVGAQDADVALYHIGNNHLHRDIYRRAVVHQGVPPGVVVLHDAALNHFFLGTLDQAGYVEEFVFNYGEWNRGLAQDLWANRARSAADPRYFEYPMLKRLVAAARTIIVHNPAAGHIVQQHIPEAFERQVRIVEIPHLFVPPALPAPVDTLRFRAQLGLRPRTLLAGVFGHLRESKRLCAILRTMDRLWKSGVDVKLLVQGAFASSDLERAMTPLLAGNPRILRIGHLSEPDFWRWAAATDVCINLRFPAAAETSGIAIRMMGIGKTVIFSAGEEVSRFPENACLRVDPGPGEEAMLADYLRWLAADREAGAEIGRHAAAHIAREHAIEKVAGQYWRELLDWKAILERDQ